MIVLSLILLPIFAGFALFVLPKEDRLACKAVASIIAAITVGLALLGSGQGVTAHWLSRPFTAAFHFADTGLAFWIVLLLALCTFSAVLASNVQNLRSFLALMLLLEGTMMGVFLARDLLLFALFWDLNIRPLLGAI